MSGHLREKSVQCIVTGDTKWFWTLDKEIHANFLLLVCTASFQHMRLLIRAIPCEFCFGVEGPLWGIPACTPQVNYSTCPWRKCTTHACSVHFKEVNYSSIWTVFLTHRGRSQALHCWGSFSSHSFCSNTFFFFFCTHEVSAAPTILTIPILGVCVCLYIVLAILVF